MKTTPCRQPFLRRYHLEPPIPENIAASDAAKMDRRLREMKEIKARVDREKKQ